ncbi:hypothetical protein ACHAWF_017828 [Thalassiosira exigua]
MTPTSATSTFLHTIPTYLRNDANHRNNRREERRLGRSSIRAMDGDDGGGLGRAIPKKRRRPDPGGDGHRGSQRGDRRGSGGSGSERDSSSRSRAEAPETFRWTAAAGRGGGSGGADLFDTSSSSDGGGSAEEEEEEEERSRSSSRSGARGKRSRRTVDGGDDVDDSEGRRKRRPAGQERPPPSSFPSGGRPAGGRRREGSLLPADPARDLPRRKSRGTPAAPARNKAERKPRLTPGDRVCAAWWPDERSRRTNSASSWYAGRIKSARKAGGAGDYGPARVYDIEYDDGDELDGVEDVFVMPEADYDVNMEVAEEGRELMGVKVVRDPKSEDQWASIVGWYVVTIDGGPHTKMRHLNLPDEWDFPSKKTTVEKLETNPREHLTPAGSDEDLDEAKTSSFKGIFFVEEKKKYRGEITYGGKDCSLGHYKLASDAAKAYDEAMKVLDFDAVNFATHKEYTKARDVELSQTGFKDDFEKVQARMSSKIDAFQSKVMREEENSLSRDNGGEESSAEEKDDTSVQGKMRGDGKTPSAAPARRDFPESDASGLVNPKGMEPAFVGVELDNKRNNKKFRAYAVREGSTVNLGRYRLESDAALAHDVGVRLMELSSKMNFLTREDYERSKTNEQERTGVSEGAAISEAEMEAKVRELIRKQLNGTEGHCHGSPSMDHLGKNDSTSSGPKHSPESGVVCPDQKMKHSIYVGVTFNKKANKFVSYVHVKGRVHLGYYRLQSDAALAHDEAVRLLKLPSKTNFPTRNEYEHSKAKELERTGLDEEDAAMTAAQLEAKVREKVDKHLPGANGGGTPCMDQRKSAPISSGSKRASDGRVVDTERKRKPKKKHSIYVGVTFSKLTNKFESYAFAGKKKVHLGQYYLESDAAFARDEAMRLLGRATETNFSSLEDYEESQTKELEKTRLGTACSMSSTRILSKVKEHLSKASLSIGETGTSAEDRAGSPTTCPKIADLNDAMAKKWAPYLSSSTGDAFQGEYNKDVEDIMEDRNPSLVGDEHCDASFTSIHSNDNLQQDSAIATTPLAANCYAAGLRESASPGRAVYHDGLRYLKPRSNATPVPSTVSIVNEPSEASITTKDSSGGQRIRGLLQQEARHGNQMNSGVTTHQVVMAGNKPDTGHRHNEPNAASTKALGGSVTVEPVDTHYVVPARSQLLELYPVQYSKLPFPVGCPVWLQFELASDEINPKTISVRSFRQGRVLAVFLDISPSSNGVFYEVELAGDDAKRTAMVTEQYLAYAQSCPVYVTPLTSETNLQGEVLMCEAQSTVSVVLYLKSLLVQKENAKMILCVIEQLDRIHITRKILEDTLIGKSIAKLKSDDCRVTEKAQKLVQKWRDIADGKKDQRSQTRNCEFTFSYTVLATSDGNKSRVKKNILAGQLVYRKSSQPDADENGSSNSTITTATGLC